MQRELPARSEAKEWKETRVGRWGTQTPPPPPTDILKKMFETVRKE